MKIFLAGTETYQSVLKNNIKQRPFILASFYYIKQDFEKLICQFGDFLCDSGAFTFCANGEFKQKRFEEYIERYADFINRNNVEKFFELDVDSITGYEKVLEYRKKLERLTNKPCIPVWHISRGKDEFIRHCDEYPYVALGGYVAAIKANDPRQKAYVKNYPWFINEAHKRNTKIHGLGFTSMKGLQKYRFDSVDSTRWNCGRFGRYEYFDGKVMQVYDWRKERKRLKSQYATIMSERCFSEWIKFQKYAEIHL